MLIAALIWICIPLSLVLIFGNIYAKFRIKQLKSNAPRSHTKYTISDSENYIPNINTIETNRFGDLCAISGLGESCFFSNGPRQHTFVTDQHGYKTLQSFSDADLVIIGDSFLAAGGGDNMHEQLGQRLMKITNKKIYEAAHPGDIFDYKKRLLEMKARQNSNKKYMLLLYEGNDIIPITTNQSSTNQSKHSGFKAFYRTFKKMPLYKLLATKLKATNKKKIHPDKLSDVKILELNHRTQALHRNQSNISKEDAFLPEIDFILKHKDAICGLAFVPTAYSVYQSRDSLAERHPSLEAQFSYLKAQGINSIDLTEVLRHQSKAENETYSLWWGDDTHWNKNGIKISAEYLAKESPCFNKDHASS